MNATDFKRLACVPFALLLGITALPSIPAVAADTTAPPASPASPASADAGIAGKWKLTMGGPNGGKIERDLTFTKTGDTYAGTLSGFRRLSSTGEVVTNPNSSGTSNGRARETTLQDVTFKDGEVSFTTSFTRRNGGGEVKRTYKGHLQGDTMEGTVEGGQTSRSWKAMRVMGATSDSGFNGVWDVTVHTENQDYKGILTLATAGGATTGTYEAVMPGRDNVKAPLKDVAVKDNTLKFGVDLPIEINGQSTLHVDYSGSRDADTLKGRNTSRFGTSDFTAVRRKDVSVVTRGINSGEGLIGAWKLTVTTPNRTFSPILILRAVGSESSGKYEGEMVFGNDRHVPLKTVTVDGNTFKATSDITRNSQTTTIEMSGTLEDGTLKGEWKSPRGTTTFTGQRQAAP